ncbi:hypothetical protein OSTOST_16308, partial [Ostertagia ostertagi]
GQSSHTFFHRDCSEELLKRVPCAECWPETTADYSSMTVNKSIPIYNEVGVLDNGIGDQVTHESCARSRRRSRCAHYRFPACAGQEERWMLLNETAGPDRKCSSFIFSVYIYSPC